MADWRQVADVKIIDNSKEVLAAGERAVYAALTKIGIAAKQNIQQIILDKDIYDTGDLYRTIDYVVDEPAQKVTVGSPQHYSVFNELGTHKMPARPFVAPGILEHRDQYKQITEDTLKNA